MILLVINFKYFFLLFLRLTLKGTSTRRTNINFAFDRYFCKNAVKEDYLVDFAAILDMVVLNWKAQLLLTLMRGSISDLGWKTI